MEYTREQILAIMRDERYPLTLKYDPDWILANSIGSHCLWLQETLAKEMHIGPDQRVLDMGCGKAICSIFLAKEFGAQVWAADLKADVSENYGRICECGVENLVYPLRADARDLPFADNFFDAMVSINSLFFYATKEGFLADHLFRHVKPGGEIGVIVPGFLREYGDEVPENLRPYWSEQLEKWHSLSWWIDCFEKSGQVDIVLADTLPDDEGNMIYRRSAMIVNAHEEPFNMIAGDNITFIRLIATRKR